MSNERCGKDVLIQKMMSAKYEILKKLVRMSGMKKRWTAKSADELLAYKRKQNAKNRIPSLTDRDVIVTRMEIMGFPVLRMTHRQKTDRANLFLIGGGMVSPPRPASIRKALRFAADLEQRGQDHALHVRSGFRL